MEIVNLSAKLRVDIGLRPRFMIREFSKPLMKHSAEYNRLIAKWTTPRPYILVEVKRGLCGSNADQVIHAFALYVNADEEWMVAKSLYDQQPRRQVIERHMSVTAYYDSLDARQRRYDAVVQAQKAVAIRYGIMHELVRLFEPGPEKDAELNDASSWLRWCG